MTTPEIEAAAWAMEKAALALNRAYHRRAFNTPAGYSDREEQIEEVARALDAERRIAIEEAARIAKAPRLEAGLERHKVSDGEAKACWLWAFDTANAIERDVRALLDQPPTRPPQT